MVERFHDKDVRSSLIELAIILPLTCIVFYVFETNMLVFGLFGYCLLYTSPSPRDQRGSRMPSSA